MGAEAITHSDSGLPTVPSTPDGWGTWVSASRTRNYAIGDPLLDWLERYGTAAGFVRDTQLESHDPRTDFTEFIFRQGRLFEEAVVRHLRSKVPVLTIAGDYEDIRNVAKAEETFDAMRSGAPVIHQGVLWDAEHRVYGAPDLLVRSDALAGLFRDVLPGGDVDSPAPDLGGPWHYRVVDAKFTTLHLAVGGEMANSGSAPAYKVQLWLYNRALGRIQGFEPPTFYLLGRGWEQRRERGFSAMERLAPISQSGAVANMHPIAALARDAVGWVRRVRDAGGTWELLPKPSLPELYPNFTNQQDGPWSRAKREIAASLEDVTMLWQVGLGGREKAHAAGVYRWTDPACTPEVVGVTGERRRPVLEALIDINRSTDGVPVRPARITAAEVEWRIVPPLEFYVDFETFSDLADDFSQFPRRGGQALIFMIGCGHVEAGEWVFRCFIADAASEEAEARTIDEWFAHMADVRGRLAPDGPEPRVIHWSPAEVSNFETAYNSASQRHSDRRWPSLAWFDFLRRVMHEEPVVVRGAMGFGLKAVSKALRQHGFIETTWDDGPADGLGAMIGAWWCYDEAARSGRSVIELSLMQQIMAYNEVDCRVMWEGISYFRQAH